MQARLILTVLVFLPASTLGQSWISSVSPQPFSSTASPVTPINITFSRQIAAETLTDSTIRIFASQSGIHDPSISYHPISNVLTIDHEAPFFPGEAVYVTLGGNIRDEAGDFLKPFSFSFVVASSGGSGSFNGRSRGGYGQNLQMMLVHDFTNDDTLDYVVLNRYGPNPIFLWDDRNEIFWYAYGLNHPTDPAWVTAGNIDNDSRTDFAIVRPFDSTVATIKLGDSHVPFQDAVIRPLGGLSRVGLSDVDNDGFDDMIVLREMADTITVLMSDRGIFDGPHQDLPVEEPSAFVVADFDNDGDKDMAASLKSANEVGIFFNDGNGLFKDSLRIPVGSEPTEVLAADLDGDGDADLVSLNKGSQSVTVLVNNGSGGWDLTIPLSLGVEDPIRLLVNDLNSDGYPDIAVLCQLPQVIVRFLNGGDLTFRRMSHINLPYEVSNFTDADVDRDGDIDLIVLSRLRYEWYLLENRVAVPGISVAPEALGFNGGWIEDTVRRPIWVKNVGGGDDLIVHASLSGNPEFSLEPDSLRIFPDDSAALIISFVPTGSREFSTTVVLMHNDSARPDLAIPVSGHGRPVRSVSPAGTMAWISGAVPFVVEFAEPMNLSSLNIGSVRVFGNRSGLHALSGLSLSSDFRTLTFTADRGFINEETVTVTLLRSAKNAAGDSIVAPFSWNISIRASSGTAVFDHPARIIQDVELEVPADIIVGDFQGDGKADLVVHRGGKEQLFSEGVGLSYPLMATDTGWVHQGGVGWLYGGLSFGDMLGNGSVGVVGGNYYQEVIYMWWKLQPGVGELLWYQTVTSLAKYPHGSLVTDFDLDGDLDVIYSYCFTGGIQTLRNEGNLNWVVSPEQFFYYPLSMIAEDLDGDGVREIVVASRGEDQISICRYNPDGSLTELERLEPGGGIREMVSADFDNDGNPDIAVSSPEGGFVKVYLNRGLFTFEEKQLAGGLHSMVAADLDGNGTVDLAGTRSDVVVILNDGTATFSEVAHIKMGTGAVGLAAVDYDRNGSVDLVATSGTNVFLLKNKPPVPDIELDRTFLEFGPTSLGSERKKRFSIINTGGAGNLEVSGIISSNASFSVSLSEVSIPIRNSVDIEVTFSPVAPRQFLDTLTIMSNDADTPVLRLLLIAGGMLVGEVDPQQNAVSGPDLDTIRVRFAWPVDETTVSPSSVKLSSTQRGMPVVTSVFDPSTGVISISDFPILKPGEQVTVHVPPGIGLAEGGLAPPFGWSFSAGPSSGSLAYSKTGSFPTLFPSSMVLADLDGDQDLDIIWANEFYDRVSLLLNNGNGTFASGQTMEGLSYAHGLTPGDFDSDGDIDLMLVHGGYVDSYTVLRNDGNAQFSGESVYLGRQMSGMVRGDFDGDGDLDFLLDGEKYILLLNDNTGHFEAYLTDLEGLFAHGEAADVNNDGLFDVVAGDYFSGILRVYANDGLALFEKKFEEQIGFVVSAITVGDFNADGLCDIAVGGLTQAFEAGVFLLWNDSTWNFPERNFIPLSVQPYKLFTGDMDADGDLDIVSHSSPGDTVTILLNNGFGDFTDRRSFYSAEGAISMGHGDIDDDGDLDLVVAAYETGFHFFKMSDGVTAVSSSPSLIPDQFYLSQNYPNPFNPSTTLKFGLPERSRVRVAVYNTLGQRVAEILDSEIAAGHHEVRWNATVASGMYICQIEAWSVVDKNRRFVDVKKLILLK